MCKYGTPKADRGERKTMNTARRVIVGVSVTSGVTKSGEEWKKLDIAYVEKHAKFEGVTVGKVTIYGNSPYYNQFLGEQAKGDLNYFLSRSITALEKNEKGYLEYFELGNKIPKPLSFDF